MNSSCYKVIFNREKQRLIVVSELAKAEGKPASSSPSFTSGYILQKICKIRPLAFGLFCALGFVSFSEGVFAETLIIQADKSAPKNQQPIILKTANGLPQVNIQTPNDKGLSHNKYSQFNVSERGAVLNNSRTHTQTQLAGQVAANPYLARGEAKVILNEVNSSKPSVMKGYVEVAGKKAEVIIANPSGLHCEGCGIINADRATFTTGKPQIKQGNLDGFVVEKGKVKVSGKGMDNSRVDYTEIIARNAEINAGIWAKQEAKVITGKNTVKRSNSDKNLQIIRTSQPLADEAQPKVAIDVGELGGMYAGKIHLIGTEHGVGVRNAGHIGASADTLTIDSQGRVVNSGTLNAQKAVQLTAQEGIANSGKIENKQNDIQLNSDSDIQNSGSIVARGGNIQQKAGTTISQRGEAVAKGNIRYTADKVEAAQTALTAAGVAITDTPQGEVRTLEKAAATGKNITVNATDKATLQGKQLASGKVEVRSSKANLNHSRTAAHSVNITASQGNLQANHAALTAEKDLSLTTPSKLDTQNSTLQAEKITTQQHSLNTQNAVWEQTGTEALKLAMAGKHQNQGGTIKTQGDFSLQADEIDNRQGSLLANGDLTLNSKGKLDSSEGVLLSNRRLAIASNEVINNNGLMFAPKGLSLKATSLNNDNGQIGTANQADITLSSHLTQQNGVIQAQTLDFRSNSLNSTANSLIFADKLSISTSGSLTNENSRIIAGTEGKINVEGALNNDYGILGGSQGGLTVYTPLALNNRQGIIAAENGTLNLQADSLNNRQGTIAAKTASITARQAVENQQTFANGTQGIIAADLTLNTRELNNSSGNIIGRNQAAIRAETIDNQKGNILTNHQADIRTEVLDNRQGLIQSNDRLTLSAETIDNQAGTISGKVADITARLIDNRAVSTQGSLIYADNLSLNAQTLDNRDTKAKGETPTQGIQGQAITIHSENLNNRQGGIYSSDTATLAVNQRLDNQQGELLAVNRIQTQHSGDLMVNNRDGLIQGGQAVELKAKKLEAEGKIKTAGDLAVDLKESFTLNNAFEANNLTFGTEGDFTNNTALVIANQIALSAKKITNTATGEIAATHTELNADTLTNRGLIDGDSTLINAETVRNIGTGRIYGNRLAFKAKTVENLAETVNGETNAATIGARSRLDFGVGKLINRDHSLILSLGDMAIGGDLDANGYAIGKAGFVDNGSATIEVLGNGKINTARLLNHDLYLKTGIETEIEHISEFGLGENATRYRAGRDGYYNVNNGSRDPYSYFQLHDGTRISGFGWFAWYYTQITHTTTLEHTDPAKLSIGGSLWLDGEQLHNKYSRLSVGKQLWLGDKLFTENPQNRSLDGGEVKLNNEDFLGEIKKVDEGVVNIENGIRSKNGKHYHYHQNNIKFGPVSLPVKPLPFNLVLNTIGTPVSSDKTIGDKPKADEVLWDTVTIDNSQLTLIPQIDSDEVVGSGQVLSKLQKDITDNIDTAELTAAMVRTHLTDIKLPQASLYKINPASPNGYIVETDPRFTNRNQWLSSDYMLKQLNYNHDNTLKRLGDGFYEQRLINEQINQLTGRRFIEGYSSDLAQYQALMNSGVKYAERFNLTVGIGLTAKQMSELTTDMVWLVNKEITLADGSTVTALVPQVYLTARNSDITSFGAVISANEIIGTADNLQNSGVIAGRDLTRIYSNQLENRGIILGDSVDLSANQTLINLGGRIEAVNHLSLYSRNNMELVSTLSSGESADGKFSRTQLDRLSEISVTGKGGSLIVRSDGDMTFKGTSMKSAGSIYAGAGGALQITTLQTHNKEHYGGGDNYYRLDQSQELGSVLSAKDNITLVSQNDTTLRQANIGSENGKVVIGSLSGDVNIEAGRAEERLATAYKSTSRGRFGLSKTTETGRYSHDMDNAVVSRISGSDVNIFAQQGGVSLEGTQVAANQDITVRAAKDVVLDAAENYAQSGSFFERKKSGATASLSKGIASVGYARSRSRTDDDNQSTSVVTTVLNAATGNLTVASSDGDVIANAAQLGAGNDIRVQGQNVHFNALTETAANQFTQSAKSSGVGVSMVYDPASVVKENFKQQGDQSSAVGIIGTIINGADASSKTVNQLMNPGSPYANHQRSQSNKNSRNEQAVVGSVNAGGNLTVVATKGDITAQGTQFSAEGDGTLWAKDNVLLGVATSRQNQQSRTTRQAASLDLAKGSTSAAGAYAEKGLGKGETLTEQAAVLSFGGNSNITAEGGNVELVGTQLVSNGANRIEAGQNVILRTAQQRTKLDESQTAHSVGEVVISDTERFAGYNRKLQSQQGEQVTHQGAMIASLNNNVDIYAGNNFHSTSGEILAKNRIGISAEEVTFEAAHNIGNSRSHQSDLKLGQFSRVSSPLIDLVQTVEQATNNHNANDRVQAAQALGAAAKAYTTAANLANGGALIRAETGTGYSHSRNKNQTANRESVGNQLNAQHIAITSRSGDINATHTAFTSKDEQGNRLKDSSVTFDSARDINFSAGQSEYQSQGRQQSSGFEAGTGVAVGAQTGWYFYAQAGFSNGKQDERHLTHHNSQIDSETVNIKSQGDATLKGATARGNRINADIQGKLTIESLQDEHRSNSSSAGFGGRVQAAIGTAWGASGYGNLASGNANAKQVAEQSGFFAEDGGYNVSANEVSLIGGAIASSNPANSTLSTNTITFSDIQNQSSSQAFTGGISGSANLNGIAGTQAKTDEQAKQQAETAKLTGTPQSNAINTGVPMFNQSRDNSTTKATLTEGTIILHKDTNPTQTTAAALGINTELAQANRQVEQPKDINQTLREQQILSQAAGNVSEAVMTYAENQKIELQQAEQKAREAAEKAAKSGDTTTALAKLQEADKLKTEAERWETGGDNKRKATAVATALSLAVAGKPTEAVAAGAASPYINEAIKHITENTDSKALEALNVPLHILWGAVEAELAGGSAKAGAVAAGVGEIGARVFAETVYGKQPSELNEEEKQNLLTTSKALAGIAVAGTSGSTGAETLANASVGMTVAENAVENNALYPNRVMRMYTELEKAVQNGTSLEDIYKKYLQISEAERENITKNCVDSPACRWGATSLLEESNQDALAFTGIIRGFFSNLSNEQQAQFLEFVIDENSKSLGILEAHRGIVEKLVTQWADEYIASKVDGLGKNISPKISAFSKKVKNNKGSAIPYPEPQSVTLDNQKVTYKSNPKHTKGMPGNRANAGIEPRNSLELFKNSIEYRVDKNKIIRYAKDTEGNIHRFFGTNGEYHWSGSSNDKDNPLPIPSDLKF